jgi:hypothetical protein
MKAEGDKALGESGAAGPLVPLARVTARGGRGHQHALEPQHDAQHLHCTRFGCKSWTRRIMVSITYDLKSRD